MLEISENNCIPDYKMNTNVVSQTSAKRLC